MSKLLQTGVIVLATALLAACSGNADDASTAVTETVRSAPLLIAVHAQGDLQAVDSTSLKVPGRQWSQRQLVWMLPDGSHVKKGEVVARFSATQSKQDLKAALIDLQRNVIARASKLADLDDKHGQLGVNLAQVASQLAIATRYANASVEALARNKLLDAVQDKQFLTTKQDLLQWRQDKSSERGQADLAVIGAKRATYELNAEQKRKDLAALELRAPHAGVLVLHSDWSGQKPHVGSNLFAGRAFGSLPDLASMQVELALPQVQAAGVDAGDRVELHPLGEPTQSVTSKISWVAAAAQPLSRRSPVKYLMIKVPVPAAATEKYGWVPGQHFAGKIILLNAESTLSVPNLAVSTGDDGSSVMVREAGRTVRRQVTLGVHGAARSQVLKGLKAGDKVVLGGAAPEAAS